MPFKKHTLTTLVATALLYFLLDAVNRALFSSAGSINGEGWIYLPAGLQLAFVLIFLGTGAAGIALASCAIGLIHGSGMDGMTVLGAGLISGFAPWLARVICLEKFKIDQQLHQLNATALLKMALTFSVLNAVIQQMWLTWCNPSTPFIQATAQMFIVNLLGTVVLFYLVKGSLSLVPAPGRLK